MQPDRTPPRPTTEEARPRTEAGRRFLRLFVPNDLLQGTMITGLTLRNTILSIEAEAATLSREQGEPPAEEVVYEENGEQVIIRRAASERPRASGLE